VVAITDVLPSVQVTKAAEPATVPEPGADVTFSVGITNTSVEPVTVDAILDAVDGGAPIDVATLPGTCDDRIGSTLAPGAGTSCQFVLSVEGSPGDDVEDIVTVSVGDDDGNQATSTAGAAVGVTDVLPSIALTKVAGVASVPEPRGEVTYTLTVANHSVEPVTLASLEDAVGDLPPVDVTALPGSTCELPLVLAVDGTYGCTFALAASGNAGDTATDTVTATAHDDDGNDATATASASVGVTDVAPTIAVTKESTTATLAAPGGPATYTVRVVNTSAEPVVIDEITDAIDGAPFPVTEVDDPVTATTCEAGVELGAAGTDDEAYECTFTLTVERSEAGSVDDVVTVTAHDDEGNDVTADDDASTPVTAVADLAIDKTVTTVPVVGQVGAYALTVRSAGPSTAEAVVVTDQLPEGMTATSAVGDGWTCTISADGRTVQCTRPSLAPGATSAIAVAVAAGQPGAAGTFTNVATVSSPTPDPDLTDNTDSVTVTPVIVLGEVITPVVLDAHGSLPMTGLPIRPWAAAAAISLLAGAWLLLGEMSLVTHGRRRRASVRSER
jgi:uncharacterized repeat protein (TIGR01451 family)